VVANLILNVDTLGLRMQLQSQPELANQGLALHDDEPLAHPLHRLCDFVCAGRSRDAAQAAEMWARYSSPPVPWSMDGE
jgi:hypothetical protein